MDEQVAELHRAVASLATGLGHVHAALSGAGNAVVLEASIRTAREHLHRVSLLEEAASRSAAATLDEPQQRPESEGFSDAPVAEEDEAAEEVAVEPDMYVPPKPEGLTTSDSLPAEERELPKAHATEPDVA